MLDFGAQLPQLRRRLVKQLEGDQPTRRRVLLSLLRNDEGSPALERREPTTD